MEQQTPGSLLPKASLQQLGSDEQYGTDYWMQNVYMYEQLLNAVREEQSFRKVWLDQTHHQHIAHAEKHSAQMEAIAERQTAKQEELHGQVIEALHTLQQSLQQSSIQGAPKKPVMPTFGDHPASIQPSVISYAQPPTPEKPRTDEWEDAGREQDWDAGCIDARLQYVRHGALEDYIRTGFEDPAKGAVGVEHGVSSAHVDWHQQVFDGMGSVGLLGRIMASYGLADLRPPNNRLAQIVHSDWFTGVLSVLIFVNTICIGVEAHVSVTHLSASPPKEMPEMFDVLDWAFIVIFLVELLLRLGGDRWWFILGAERKWNILDFLLVVTSVFAKLMQGNAVLSVRAFRVFRSVRVLRIIRVLRFFRDLRMMVLAIGAALWSLAWAFLLLLLIMFVFAITIMQSIASYLKNADPEDNSLDGLLLWYGSLPTTMFSLMQAISGGADWGDIVEPLEQISGWWRITFTIYIVFVVFGVLNILTGVFVNTASEIMDRDLIVHFEEERAESFIKDMKALFDEFDVENNRALTWKIFKQYMKNVKVQAYLAAIGLDCSDAFTLFKLMDKDEDMNVDIMQFILGCVRLRGQAKSVDLMILTKDLEHQGDCVNQIQANVKSTHDMLSEMFKTLGFAHVCSSTPKIE